MRDASFLSLRTGDIWLAAFDPVVGREQAGTRPALIVSSDRYHQLQAGLVTVVPITGRERDWPNHVPVTGPATGLLRPSFAIADQVRSMSVRRVQRRLGNVDHRTLNLVRRYLVAHLELRDLSDALD